MNLHHFPYFDPTKKSSEKSFSGIPYLLHSIKKSARAHNVFFSFGFWASLERRSKIVKVKSFYNYPTHHLQATIEISNFFGAPYRTYIHTRTYMHFDV